MKRQNKKEKTNKKTLKNKAAIQYRMLKSYIIVIAISVVSSIVALAMLGFFNTQYKQFYNENYIVTSETWQARYAEIAARKALLAAMVDQNLKVTKAEMAVAAEQLEEMGAILQEMKKSYSGDLSKIDKMEEERQAALVVFDEMMKSTGYAQYETASNIMKEKYTPIVDSISLHLEEIAIEEDTNAKKSMATATTLMVVANLAVLLVLGVSIIVAMRLGRKLAKSISSPIKELEGAAHQLAEGNLNVQIAYNGKDELGRFADSMRASCSFMQEVIEDADSLLKEIAEGNFQAFTAKEHVYIGDFKGLLVSIRQLREQLRDTLTEINEASSQVSLGAEQLAGAAQSLAEGASDQAGAVEELTAMVNGVTDIAKNTVVITNESYEQAIQFKEEVKASQSEMSNLLDAMERIKETSGNIEKIIVEIEDIASQTNLLSLNASIEAARAGEAGRGFAVVADQIGKLANDCAQSSINTKQLIQQAIDEVENGNMITNKTSETLEKVAEGIEALANSVQEINVKATDQADSISQVEIGIEQITTVIESNSSAAQETSATSQELSAQADRLQGLVGQFKL